MSYQVLARKWRPQNFREVIGQPHVTRTLQNAIDSQRIAHAYLFTGARGVGKTSVARILAKTLNCTSSDHPRPCNSCSNCREITLGNSVDVLEIDGASNRGIDNIRELRETVRYRPAKSPYKIYIIDEVHMLTTEAFNALLKTLEEPPDHILFLFATTEPHRIPATILSRCQRFDFRRIPTSEIVKHLSTMTSKEDVALSDAVLYAVAREADGSMRDAQSLLEQILAFSSDNLADEEVLDILGVIDRRSVHKIGNAVLDGDVGACIEVVTDLYRRGIDSRRFCQQVCDHFRNLLFCALGDDDGANRIDLPTDERQELIESVKKTTPETLFLHFQMLLKGEQEIRRSSLPRIALEMLLLRLTQLPHIEAMENLIEKLTLLEGRLSGGKDEMFHREVSKPHPERSISGSISTAGTPEAVETASHALTAPPDASPEDAMPTGAVPSAPTSIDIHNRWEAFVRYLQDHDPILAAKLTHSRISRQLGSAVDLEVLEIYENALLEPQALTGLSEAAQTFWGRTFEWTIKTRPSIHEAPEDSRSPRKPKSNPTRLVLEHPVVQQALEVLGGELVDIQSLKHGRPKRGKD